MRNARLLLLLLSSLAIASPPAGAGSPEAMAGDLRVGGAAIDITPPDGVPMAGCYHIRTATGVHDPLQACGRGRVEGERPGRP
jgi:hypothetical protein